MDYAKLFKTIQKLPALWMLKVRNIVYIKNMDPREVCIVEVQCNCDTSDFFRYDTSMSYLKPIDLPSPYTSTPSRRWGVYQ